MDATEISSKGVAYAKSRGHALHYGTVLEKNFDNSSYDIITMWHVLEHLSEPGKTLKRVRSLLKDDGLLFIAVPNEFLRLISPLAVSGILPAFHKHKFDKEVHLTHYTPATLSRALETIFGFKVVSLLADDVHVYHRLCWLPFFYVNSVMAKLFRFHLDKAMVLVCKKYMESD